MGAVDPTIVRDERPCLACGYSLKGLAMTANCPECGSPVASSVISVLLLHASERRLRAVTFRLRGVLWCVVAALLTVCVGVLAALALSVRATEGEHVLLLNAAGIVLLGLLLCAGAFWIAALHPYREADGVLPWSQSSRWLLLGWLTATGAAVLLFWQDQSVGGLALVALIPLLLAGWMLATSGTLREIALRLADYYNWRRLRWGQRLGLANIVCYLLGLLLAAAPMRNIAGLILMVAVFISFVNCVVWTAMSLEAVGRSVKSLRRIERYRFASPPAEGG